jgi:DNA-binding NarL/FixJ family response regulator
MEKIKLIIADDHPMVIDGLENYFKTFDEIEIVATTSQLTEVIKLISIHEPDILLLDYHFINEENLTGLDICKETVTKFPCTKVIIISSFAEISLIKDFIDAGAKGYLLKTATRLEFIDAILNVFAGGESFGKDIRDLLVKDRLDQTNSNGIRFTKTEKEILKLIIEGYSTQDMAKKLFREKSTIDTHRKSILSKFHVMDANNPKPCKNIMYYVNKYSIAGRIDCM